MIIRTMHRGTELPITQPFAVNILSELLYPVVPSSLFNDVPEQHGLSMQDNHDPATGQPH